MKKTIYLLFILTIIFIAIFTGCTGTGDDPGITPSIGMLSSLSFSSGTISPEFDPEVFEYTVTVDYTVDSITITPVLSSSNITVVINDTAVDSNVSSDPILLDYGNNTITVTISETDSAETAIKTYIITVIRQRLGVLSSLEFSEGTISPEFDPEVSAYTVPVEYSVDSITVTPVLSSSNITVVINGTAVDSNVSSDPISLVNGNNTITVTISETDSAETTVKTYTITVIRQGAVFSLDIDNKDIIPAALTYSLNILPDIMSSTVYDPYTPGTSVSVPGGENFTFELITDIAEEDTSAVLSYKEETGTQDEIPITDSASQSLSLTVNRTKLIIPDMQNNRIVQIDSMDGGNWIEMDNTGDIFGSESYSCKPTDIDFDAAGRIYIANYISDEDDVSILRIDSMDSTIEEKTPVVSDVWDVNGIAIDKTANILYYIFSGEGYELWKVDLETLDADFLDNFTVLTGITIDSSGMLYLSHGYAGVSKYDPVDEEMAIDETNLGKIIWDVLITPTDELYAVNNNGDSEASILQLNPTDLSLITEYGSIVHVPSNEPGEFYGPTLFVGTLNDNITFIDESLNGNLDKLVSLSELSDAGWTTYGSSGGGTGYFSFFYYEAIP